jgi:hypothetical protein
VRPRSSLRAKTGDLNWRGGRGRWGVVLAVEEDEGREEASDWDWAVGVEGRRRGERKGALTGVRRRRLGSRSSMARGLMDEGMKMSDALWLCGRIELQIKQRGLVITHSASPQITRTAASLPKMRVGSFPRLWNLSNHTARMFLKSLHTLKKWDQSPVIRFANCKSEMHTRSKGGRTLGVSFG